MSAMGEMGGDAINGAGEVVYFTYMMYILHI